MNINNISLSVAALIATGLSACSPTKEIQTYGDFLTAHSKDYPATMEVYMNKESVAKATPESPIHICLEQQRGRLYVDGQVAADWPVSTGKPGSETPVGTFRIKEKKKKHFSSLWGTIVDKDDICVVESADSRKDKVPAGGEFLGAKMENWQRLTDNGVGIHTGRVRAGEQLSKGCVRTPGFVADMLFNITKVGTKVTITRKPEPMWIGNTPSQPR
ncbi:MAG: L,D-transpeptidase family protein [Akkermansia sp.]|nr:L,D-transpeptidase family protein [Akkermansia sp.]